MKKKVAVFTSSWNGEVSYEIFKGMKEQAEVEEADIYVFCCYSHGTMYDELFEGGENNIYNLPELTDFDGAVIITNDAGSPDVIEKLHKKVLDAKIPCVSLEQELDGVPFIGTDNYTAMFEMTEHLIEQHHCRTINYVGGPSDHMENILRRRGYEDALKKHGLFVEPDRILEYSYMQQDGEKAFYTFREKKLECPDAVVCANDSMAIGYIREAVQNGFSVPEDFIVTGFDNLDMARDYSPRITSVGREREGLGRRSIQVLFQMMHGYSVSPRKFLPHRCEFTESCGCLRKNLRDADAFRIRSFQEKNLLLSNGIKIDHFQREILKDLTREGFSKALDKYLSAFEIKKFCLCLNYTENENDLSAQENLGREGFSRYMDVFYVYRENAEGNERNFYSVKNTEEPQKLPTRELVPGYLRKTEESNFYMILPVQYNGRRFGYGVFFDQPELILQFKLFHWLSALNLGLEEIRRTYELRRANEKLNALYIRDSMTGLYNRFGLRQKGEPLFSRNLCEGRGITVMFIDMDGLSKINEAYGHEMGDVAIKAVANCVELSVKGMDAVVIRYGGDEFLVLMSSEKERVAKHVRQDIYEMLKRYNHYSRLPFRVLASIGYAITDASGEYALKDYIEQAEKEMQEEKKINKKEQDF